MRGQRSGHNKWPLRDRLEAKRQGHGARGSMSPSAKRDFNPDIKERGPSGIFGDVSVPLFRGLHPCCRPWISQFYGSARAPSHESEKIPNSKGATVSKSFQLFSNVTGAILRLHLGAPVNVPKLSAQPMFSTKCFLFEANVAVSRFRSLGPQDDDPVETSTVFGGS